MDLALSLFQNDLQHSVNIRNRQNQQIGFVLGRAGLAWGAKGPGPGRLGLGGQGSWAGPAWLGGPRVLGRTGLVLNTLKNHDSDGDVNIIRRRTMTVIRMLI